MKYNMDWRRTVGQNRVKVGQKSKLPNVTFFIFLGH